MRKLLTLLFMSLFVGTGSVWADADLTISNVTEWKAFCSNVNNGTNNYSGKTVVLAADIEMEASGFQAQTVGNSDANSFQGIFDGQGHTITYDFSDITKLNQVAPFRYIKNATIKNLKTAGTLGSTGTNMGGVVSTASGTCVIESCECSMAIISKLASGESNSGGIVGITIADANLTVNNCIFSGSITVNKPGDEKTKRYCGIVGYLRTPSTSHIISNCLNIGTISGEGLDTGTNSSNVIYRAGGTTTSSNNYYLKDWGTNDNATLITNEQLNSGEVAYNLQGNQATQYWGQSNLNKSTAESLPKLTSTTADKVIKISFYNGSAVVYANYNGPYNAVAKNVLSFYSGGAETANYGPYTTDVTVSRSVSKYILNVSSAGATTLVLPGNVSSLPANVKAYELTYTSGEKVTASEITSIAANKPVLINAPEGQYVLTTDNTGTEITYDKENAHQNGALYGVYTDTYKYVPADSYVLQNGEEGLGFYKVKAENTIKITSFRAYLTAQDGLTPAPRLSIVYNNNTTGINSVREQTNNDDAIYTLNGVRVSRPTRESTLRTAKSIL